MGDELKNITDILVFEECRQPYILQVTEEYQNFRLGFFCVQIVSAIACLALWIKLRPTLPRLLMRPLAVTAILFTNVVIEAVLDSLAEGLLDKRNIFNQCAFFQFWYHFLISASVFGFVLNLAQYYNKYRLYKAVVGLPSPNTFSVNSASLFGISQAEKVVKLHKYTTDKFITKVALIGIFIISIFSFGATVVFCPEFGSELCPHKEDVKLDEAIYFVGVVICVIVVIGVIYSTFKYPDPFGIIREVLLSTILLFLQVVSYFVLTGVLEFSTGEVYPVTAFITVTIFGFMQFLLAFPFQIYMASKYKNVELNLETILNTPASVKIFRLHVRRDFTEENLNFYLRVKEFKKGFNSNEDNHAVAKDIIETYILIGAPQQLNIGESDMKSVLYEFESDRRLSASIFDEVQMIILSAMESDSYTRFVNGPLYRLYLGIVENDTETDLSSFKTAVK